MLITRACSAAILVLGSIACSPAPKERPAHHAESSAATTAASVAEASPAAPTVTPSCTGTPIVPQAFKSSCTNSMGCNEQNGSVYANDAAGAKRGCEMVKGVYSTSVRCATAGVAGRCLKSCGAKNEAIMFLTGSDKDEPFLKEACEKQGIWIGK